MGAIGSGTYLWMSDRHIMYALPLDGMWPEVALGVSKNAKTTSVVQWRPFSPLFFVAAPLKMVFPKKGSLFFSRVTEQLSNRRQIAMELFGLRPAR